MVSEYRFLRFEIVGLATIFFYIAMILPVSFALIRANLRDFGTSFAVISGLFLLSVPLGYWEHQLVVNLYRAEKHRGKEHELIQTLRRWLGQRPKSAHEVLRRLVLAAEHQQTSNDGSNEFFESLDSTEQASFLTALEDLCIHSDQMGFDSDVYNRISDRWSHFYARKAITLFAPPIALILWGITVVCAWHFGWRLNFRNIYLSIVVFLALTITNWALIHPYARKLWNEIDFLESQLLAFNVCKVKSVVDAVVKAGMEHKDYFDRQNVKTLNPQTQRNSSLQDSRSHA